MIAPEWSGSQGAGHRLRFRQVATLRFRRSAALRFRNRPPSRSPLTRTHHRSVAALLGALLVPACTLVEIATRPRVPRCDGVFQSTRALPPGDRVWRDRARYRGEDVDARFLLVAEKRSERLVLVGLNAFGARVLSVTQEGGHVTVDARLGRALEVPPENVLRDWHAARATGLAVGEKFDLSRPECGYHVTFVLEEARALSASPSP